MVCRDPNMSPIVAQRLHIVVLATVASCAAYSCGVLALVVIPLWVMLYLLFVYRKCPWRTEIIFLCLYGAELIVWFFFPWFVYVPLLRFNWFNAILAGVFFAFPLLAVWTYSAAGVPTRPQTSGEGSRWAMRYVSSGTIVAALMLSPSWILAFALARPYFD